MKRIIFYSYNGTHTPTLAALAYFKPKDVEIEWYVHTSEGKLYSEFFDVLISLEQLGFDYQFLSNNPITQIREAFLKKYVFKKYNVPFAKSSLQKKN